MAEKQKLDELYWALPHKVGAPSMPVAGIQGYMTPYTNVGLIPKQLRREQENSIEQKAMDTTPANTQERPVPSGAR